MSGETAAPPSTVTIDQPGTGGPTRPVRLAVLVRAPHYWGALAPLVRAGRHHRDVALEVIVMDGHPAEPDRPTIGEHRRQLSDLAAAEGAVVRDAAWLLRHRSSVDVAICADGYDAGGPVGLTTRELAAAGIRIVLSPYAQALSGHPGNARLLFNQPIHNLAWRIYAASPGQRDCFATYCDAGAGSVRLLGNLKRERLLTSPALQSAAAELRRRLATRTATLWNPHFIDTVPISTFFDFGPAIVDWFAQRPDHGLILRPHPLLFRLIETSGSAGAGLVEQLRATCAAMPNVVLDESVDCGPALLAADALVSDLSSLLPDYAVLGRPSALLLPRGPLPLNADAAALAGTVRIADARPLTAFLARVEPARNVDPGDRAHGDLGTAGRIMDAIVADVRAELAG